MSVHIEKWHIYLPFVVTIKGFFLQLSLCFGWKWFTKKKEKLEASNSSLSWGAMLSVSGSFTKRPAFIPGHAFPLLCLLFKLMNQVLLGTISSEFGWVWLFQPLCSYFFVSAYVWDCLLGMPWCQSGECALWNHRACVHSLAPWCEGFITDHSVPLHPHLWMGTVTVPIYRAMVMNTWMTTCNQQKELEQYLAQKYVHSIDIN